MRLRAISLTFWVSASAAILAQSTPYPVYETDTLPPDEFRARRQEVKKAMGPGSLAVLFTNPTRNRNNDVDFVFRGDSNFLYLTGFEEPDAALILAPDGFELGGRTVTEVLFVNEANSFSLTWEGYRMGSENARTLLGVEAAAPNSEFQKVLQLAAGAASQRKLSVSVPPQATGGGLGRMITQFETWRGGAAFGSGVNLRQKLSAMRGVKSPKEIELIRKAAEISALAHVEAMRSIEPGMREWHISALVQYVFAREGCEYPGYPPIVGSGPNSTILHYQSNRRKTELGDMICMDTAGEYHGYSADVTRSFPVGGKFSPEQRAIYEVVLAAQEAGIAACKPGGNPGSVGNIVSQKLAEGLIALGLIESARELNRYYMHGFGHGIGLDVHDPLPGTFVPGVCLTVEPGIYIKDGSPCDKKWWNIGIRIEDDILVSESGPVNLSKDAPRTIADIERLMAEKGLGNVESKPWKRP